MTWPSPFSARAPPSMGYRGAVSADTPAAPWEGENCVCVETCHYHGPGRGRSGLSSQRKCRQPQGLAPPARSRPSLLLADCKSSATLFRVLASPNKLHGSAAGLQPALAPASCVSGAHELRAGVGHPQACPPAWCWAAAAVAPSHSFRGRPFCPCFLSLLHTEQQWKERDWG